jgi:hypothetical protein
LREARTRKEEGVTGEIALRSNVSAVNNASLDASALAQLGRMSHTTVIVATLGGRVIGCTCIVSKPSLQTKEDVIHSVKVLTDRGQFCRYSASSNGWCEKKIKKQFCQDVVNRINGDSELSKLYILVTYDAHFSNLQTEVVDMFRAERYSFMFTPSKLTAYLQAADAPFGIITTMQKLAQTFADDNFYLQKIMKNVFRDALLPTIMEKVIETLQLDPEKYGALIKKSWEQVGNEKPLAKVPGEIKSACAELLQLHKDNVSSLSSARTLSNMTSNMT